MHEWVIYLGITATSDSNSAKILSCSTLGADPYVLNLVQVHNPNQDEEAFTQNACQIYGGIYSNGKCVGLTLGGGSVGSLQNGSLCGLYRFDGKSYTVQSPCMGRALNTQGCPPPFVKVETAFTDNSGQQIIESFCKI